VYLPADELQKQTKKDIYCLAKSALVMAEAHDNTPAGQFRQRLDNNAKKMVDNFSGLIKTARIDEKPQYSREAFQTSVHATSLVRPRLAVRFF
jgi:hypothetical protein